MFGLFKKREPDNNDMLAAVIERTTAFSVRLLEHHKMLLAATPDSKTMKTLLEALLFNNWVSYYVISDELCAGLPTQATNDDRSSLRQGIRKAIITSAKSKAIPSVERQLGCSFDQLHGGDFIAYANRVFQDYDSSAERHQSPAWMSAGIKLACQCDLGGVAIAEIGKARELEEEAAQLFFIAEDLIRKDVREYVRNRR